MGGANNVVSLFIFTLSHKKIAMNPLFEKAVERSKSLPSKPSNDVLLKLYSLFKQGTLGDNFGERPTGFDFKAIAKYDAWENQKGKSKEAAQDEYVSLVESLEG